MVDECVSTPETCPNLFPEFEGIPPETGDGKVMFRPPPIGGHIRLLQYNRYLSNRLREYGPYDRFINYPKLLFPITLHDIYDMNRYFIALKHVVMGVVEEERLPFQDQILPNLGMECGASIPVAPVPETVPEPAA